MGEVMGEAMGGVMGEAMGQKGAAPLRANAYAAQAKSESRHVSKSEITAG